MHSAPPIWRSVEESDESAVRFRSKSRRAAIKKKEAELAAAAANRNLPKKVYTATGKFHTCPPLECFRKMQQNRKILGMQALQAELTSGVKTEAEFAGLSLSLSVSVSLSLYVNCA